MCCAGQSIEANAQSSACWVGFTVQVISYLGICFGGFEWSSSLSLSLLLSFRYLAWTLIDNNDIPKRIMKIVDFIVWLFRMIACIFGNIAEMKIKLIITISAA
jgi:hypothetical protein